ncbi:MAG: extracellular solute-binding protein [Mesorhizobium sp.]|nr:extracellular solute-binding protein [Mesorhizobium sp.]
MIFRKSKPWVRAIVASGIVATLASGAANAQQDMDFSGEELLAQTYGGTIAAYFRENFAKEFNEKFNANVIIQDALSVDTVAKLRTDGGVPHVDTFMVTAPWAVILEAEGLVEPLDAENVPSLSEIEPHARPEGDSYVTWSSGGQAIVYNTKLLKKEDLPKKWSDLADPKYKGKLTLPPPSNAQSLILISRLATLDGGSVENIDSAIETLKTIAPNVLTFWTSHDQDFSLLNAGESWLTVDSQDRTIDQVNKGASVAAYYPDEGTAFMSNTIGVAKGTEHKELAEAWINFLLEKDQQTRIANYVGYLPVRSDAEIDPKVAAHMPQGTALENSVFPDWGVISNKQADWIERYTKEVIR